MAKIVKMNPAQKEESDFKEFTKNLPKEEQDLLKKINIRSNEDMAAFVTALGIDLDKMLNYSERHPEADFEEVSFNEFMMDADHPLYQDTIWANESDEDFYDEGSYLPERAFIGKEAVEYHIRMKLNNAPLPIWREVKLPSNITLEALSYIIIDTMGWEDRHLHQFKKGDTLYKNTEDLEEEEDIMPFSRFRKENSNNWSLDQVLPEKGDRIEYEYDFGDEWRHEIWVKGIREYNPGEYRKLTIIKGKGACPPEDCGGVWGYSDLLRIHAKKRKTKEEKEQLEWYYMDKYFNPEEFDVEETQACLDALWEELLELEE